MKILDVIQFDSSIHFNYKIYRGLKFSLHDFRYDLLILMLNQEKIERQTIILNGEELFY